MGDERLTLAPYSLPLTKPHQGQREKRLDTYAFESALTVFLGQTICRFQYRFSELLSTGHNTPFQDAEIKNYCSLLYGPEKRACWHLREHISLVWWYSHPGLGMPEDSINHTLGSFQILPNIPTTKFIVTSEVIRALQTLRGFFYFTQAPLGFRDETVAQIRVKNPLSWAVSTYSSPPICCFPFLGLFFHFLFETEYTPEELIGLRGWQCEIKQMMHLRLPSLSLISGPTRGIWETVSH